MTEFLFGIWVLFVCTSLWNTMDYMEQMDEDQLIEIAIQMSLQDTCSFSVLNEPLRYSMHKHLCLLISNIIVSLSHISLSRLAL